MISINNAAYKKGSTANAEINREIISNPDGISLLLSPAIEELINQKTRDKYRKIKSGWSVGVRIKCLPRMVMVEDIFIDQLPMFKGVSIGNIQAVNAKITDIAIPSPITNRL
ncbi:MAG: hypothetical protein ABIJ65_06355 [Chloroflexota bacterium]